MTTKKTSILNKKLTGFKYRDEDQEKLHNFFIKVLKAFNPEDVQMYKKDVTQFLRSPILEHEKSRYFSTKSVVEINYRQFVTDVTFWLKTTFFRFTRKNVRALIMKARQMKQDGLSSDDVLMYALSTIPTINSEYVPKEGLWMNNETGEIYKTKKDSYIPRDSELNSENEVDEVLLHGEVEDIQITVFDLLKEFSEYKEPKVSPKKDKVEIDFELDEPEESNQENLSKEDQVSIDL